jgi:hypothetical protein
MHENGHISVFVSNFRYPTEEIVVEKIVKILEHETLHFAIDKTVKENIPWQVQDRVIGKMVKQWV